MALQGAPYIWLMFLTMAEQSRHTLFTVPMSLREPEVLFNGLLVLP
jgi:hypothetical protein